MSLSPEQRLAEFASTLEFAKIPEPVVRRCEALMLDWFGSALAGKGMRPVQTIESFATINFTWLHRKSNGNVTPGGLASVVKAIARPGEDTVIWVAAESSIVKSIRKHALLEWGVDHSRLHAAGYWKRGDSDHRDEEGFE